MKTRIQINFEDYIKIILSNNIKNKVILGNKLLIGNLVISPFNFKIKKLFDSEVFDKKYLYMK